MLFASLLAGLCALQVPEPPGAAPGAWQAPPECPDRAALTRAIERRLGRTLAEGEVRLAGTISRQATGPRFRMRLELTVGDGAQIRTLTAARCPSLVDATALLVVLALNHSQPPVVPEAPEPVEPGEIYPEPAPATDSPAIDTLDAAELAPAADGADSIVLESPLSLPPAAPPRRRPGGLVRVHGGPEYGAVPGVTGAVGLVAGVLWRRARLELHGLHVAPRTETLGAHALRASLFTGAALGCGRPWRGVLEFPLCGGLELGAVRSVATGPGARSGADVWLAGIATAGVAWHLGRRWSLTAALHGLVHIYFPRFELRDPGPGRSLFRPAPASVRLLFGLEVRLGDPW